MPDADNANDALPRQTTRRPLVLMALLLAMFMAAIEGTIVATAMPSIATDLNGFSLYSWVFSAYLLTQAVTIPIFGKLADLFGRKRVFIIGVVIFLAGSILCGLAPTMTALVGFRLLQGVGAGAVQPLTVTLAGDLYTLAERGRIQGFMSAVWGVSAIIGPLTGGLIVQYGYWPWIFWMNIPFGLFAILLVGLFLHERVERKDHSIDYAGAGLFLVGLGALMLALTQSADWSGSLLAGQVSTDSIQNLLDEAGPPASVLSGPVLEVLQAGLGQGLQLVFWGVAAFAAITALVSWRVPRLRSES